MSDSDLDDGDVGLFGDSDLPDTQGAGDALLSQSVDAERQYITFTIDQEEYGTPILTVQEIRGWMKTTPLPNMPDFVKGVTNLRGNIVPVFDLRSRFCGKMTEVTERHVVIMAQLNHRTIGLLVDAISDILTIDAAQIQPPPVGNLLIDVQYLDGLVATKDRMVALVNIGKLFDVDLMNDIGDQGATISAKEA